MSDAGKVELVLLTGLLSDETVWADVVERLRGRARVTILSFEGLASFAAMAAHVLERAPPRFVLVGHSMGARVALEVIKLAPERVMGLGLFNTGVHAVGKQEPANRARLIKIAVESGMRALADEWLPPMLNNAREPDEKLLARLGAMIERYSAEDFKGQVNAMLNRPDAEAALAGVKVPVLLLSATGDQWSPIAQHEAMRRFAPHAKLAIIEDAGHMAPLEQPDDVAAVLSAWLEELCVEKLSDVEQLVIEARCTRLINRYARLSDAGDYEALANLYTEDAVFARPSEPDVQIRGRAAILASFKSRPARLSRHVMAGIDVTVESPTRARARSLIILFMADAVQTPPKIGATLVGAFDDVFERVGDQWLFAQRLGVVDMKG